MSNQLITRVMADQRPKGAARMVLFILADQANDNGECWPGYTSISKRAALSRMSSIRAVGWLEEHGYLVVTRRPVPGSRHESNKYLVRVPAGDTPGSSSVRAVGTKRSISVLPGAKRPEGVSAPGYPARIMGTVNDKPGHKVDRTNLVAERVPRYNPVNNGRIPRIGTSCDPGSNSLIPRSVTACDPVGNRLVPESLINPNINPNITSPVPPPLPPQDEQAPEHLESEKLLSLYRQNFGKITPLVAGILAEARRKWPVEWIEAAMRESVVYNHPNWKYCEGILKRWQREGFGVDSRPKSPPGSSSGRRMTGEEFNGMLQRWVNQDPSGSESLLLQTGDVWLPK